MQLAVLDVSQSRSGATGYCTVCRRPASAFRRAYHLIIEMCSNKDDMKTETFIRRSRIDAPAAEVYAWHALPGALERLTPPGEHVKVIEKTSGIERGARVVLQFGRWPFRRRWVAEHRDFEVGRYFSDVQVAGPFAYWKHTHTFEPDGPSACFLEDRVEYALPFGVLGRWIAGWYVRRKLDKLFEYRHQVTAREV
jgi:ligand-binding SRPBCC domain-containing protein